MTFTNILHINLENRYLYLLIFLFFFSCTKNDNIIDFTFLQLNDVYEIAPIQAGKYGGMARVETVHKNLLKENKNTMLFMAGDFLNPSLLGTLKVDGARVKGKQMIEVMNAMNFDLVAFGNHEFDISKNELQQRLNESTFNWISANVKLKTPNGSVLFYKEQNGVKTPTNTTFIKTLKDKDGTTIKVGFISVCIPSNPKDYVEYGNMFVKARASYAALKDKVDVVFGLTHVKLANDKRIAKLLPNIPLIMGGHEHTNSNTIVNNVQIAKADANAKTVYIHKIRYDKLTKKAVVTSELKEITSAIPEDKAVHAIVNKWQNLLDAKIKDIVANPKGVIYNAKKPLDGRDTPIRSTPTNLGKHITNAMVFAYGDATDGALVNGGSIRLDDQLIGAITPIDIFRVLPYGGSIINVTLKGRLLKRVLDYGVLAKGTGAYLHRSGLEKRKNTWFVNNNALDTNKTYTIAFSDYLLKGFDIPFLNPDNPEVLNVYHPKNTEMASDIRKAVINYLKTQ